MSVAKDTAKTIGGFLLVVGALGALVYFGLRRPGPSGDPNRWMFAVSPDGKFPDGSQKYAVAIAPDVGENWSWDFVGRAFKSAEEARAAAVAAIEAKGAKAFEFIG